MTCQDTIRIVRRRFYVRLCYEPKRPMVGVRDDSRESRGLEDDSPDDDRRAGVCGARSAGSFRHAAASVWVVFFVIICNYGNLKSL